MSLVLQSSGGGQITIQEPATASNFTQTLPAADGTVMVSGNQPAFSAFNSGTQTVSHATATKLVLNTERFDTANAFDNTSNYRFTPLVAGYYQINISGYGFPSVTGTIGMYIYKNGSNYSKTEIANANGGPQVTCSTLLFLNGTTDYCEAYTFQTSGSNLTMSGQDFSGTLVRAS
jgi:hypothetical protein